jgi:SAM-dependent methyltransferase
MRPDEYRIMHAQEAHHWWFRGRRLMLADLLERERRGSTQRILDFGSGTGGNVAMAGRVGQVIGIEPDAGALELARARGGALFSRAVGTALPFRDGSFDLVLASDVLEHIGDDALAASEIHRVLRRGGSLIFSVPAHPWLFAPHDRALRHQRRYTRRTIRRVLEGAGLTVAWLSYWNTILFPVAVAARLAKRFGNADSRSDIRDVAPWLNQSLTAVLAFEARTLQVTQLPWGVSLIGIASRA